MVVYGGVWWCMVVYGGVWCCSVVYADVFVCGSCKNDNRSFQFTLQARLLQRHTRHTPPPPKKQLSHSQVLSTRLLARTTWFSANRLVKI
jgi:hypothetical protein